MNHVPVPFTNTELQSYECLACGAKPGERCHTIRHHPGRPRPSVPTQPHEARWDAARAARQRTPDPVVKRIVDKLYGGDESEVRVHFIYDARRDPSKGTPHLWCSCHEYFGDDRAAAERHILDAQGIPEWMMAVLRAAEHTVDGMAVMELDSRGVTDQAEREKYTHWLRSALAEMWISAASKP